MGPTPSSFYFYRVKFLVSNYDRVNFVTFRKSATKWWGLNWALMFEIWIRL